MSSPKPITLAIIGCGQCGQYYAAYARDHPEQCKVAAIAEPRPQIQKLFTDSFNINKSLVFDTWQDLHAASTVTLSAIGKRLTDAVIVAVQDKLHHQVTIAFAKQGYHILCETPMATTIEECIQMERAVKEAGIIFGVSHILRYTPYFRAVDKIVASMELGELVNVVHVEPVGYYHFAHSYVRGNWNEENKSTFSLMTHGCHDIDLLCHWFAPLTPTRVSSFGSLQHFRKAAKPKEAGSVTRCWDCAYEKECPYSAKKIYYDSLMQGNKDWPVNVLVDDVPDIENITEALRTGPYGKCVYESPNDVCDHQVVNLEFSNGATASFTMVAYTTGVCNRQTRWHFTHGEIIGDLDTLTVTDFRKPGKTIRHRPTRTEVDLDLISAFVKAVREGRQEILGMDASDVLRSHLTVFAAEVSRREGRVTNCKEFEKVVRELIIGS